MRSIFLVILAAGLLLLGSPVEATVAVKRDFPDLVARAEQIVVGTVIRISQADDATGVRRTLISVSDLSVLKGRVDGSELTLDFLGGEKGGMVSRVLDFPAFREGERAVLFVSENGRAACPLVGVWQGRLRVLFDAARGEEIIAADDGRRIVGLAQRELRYAERDGAADTALTLDELRRLIADELAQPTSR